MNIHNDAIQMLFVPRLGWQRWLFTPPLHGRDKNPGVNNNAIFTWGVNSPRGYSQCGYLHLSAIEEPSTQVSVANNAICIWGGRVNAAIYTRLA